MANLSTPASTSAFVPVVAPASPLASTSAVTLSSSGSSTSPASFDGWFLYHSAGVYPGQRDAIARALTDFTSAWCAPDDDRWDVALQARDALLANWATLIGAPPSSLFPAPNVTEASPAASMRWVISIYAIGSY